MITTQDIPLKEQVEKIRAGKNKELYPGGYFQEKKLSEREIQKIEYYIENEKWNHLNKLIEKEPYLWPYINDLNLSHGSILYSDKMNVVEEVKADRKKIDSKKMPYSEYVGLMEKYNNKLSYKRDYFNINITRDLIMNYDNKKESQSISFSYKDSSKMKVEEYISTFTKHINTQTFFNKEKVIILKDLFNVAKDINDKLSKFRELNIYYSLDLSGGAVRDFILNKHNDIKDLDFMLSIDDKYLDIKTEELLKNNIFTIEDLQNVEWKDDDLTYIKKINLVQMLFKDDKKLQDVYSVKSFFANPGIKDEYKIFKENESIERRNRTLSVTKLNYEKYPVDIILTGYPKPDYLNTFDFNICKASLCFHNDNVNMKFPQHYFNLLHRFNAEKEFWFDVNKKVISMNVRKSLKSIKSFERQQHSGLSHYERLKNKYNDYNLLIYYPVYELNNGNGNKNGFEDMKEFIDSFNAIMSKNKLNDGLDNKKINNKTKKIKI